MLAVIKGTQPVFYNYSLEEPERERDGYQLHIHA